MVLEIVKEYISFNYTFKTAGKCDYSKETLQQVSLKRKKHPLRLLYKK